MKKIIIFALSSAPFFALAVDFKGLMTNFGKQIQIIPGFILALAVIYFLYNVFLYIQSGGDPKKAEDAAKMITYSLIAMFVMVSVYGLVRVVQNTFNLGNNSTITAPTLPSLN